MDILWKFRFFWLIPLGILIRYNINETLGHIFLIGAMMDAAFSTTKAFDSPKEDKIAESDEEE